MKSIFFTFLIIICSKFSEASLLLLDPLFLLLGEVEFPHLSQLNIFAMSAVRVE